MCWNKRIEGREGDGNRIRCQTHTQNRELSGAASIIHTSCAHVHHSHVNLETWRRDWTRKERNHRNQERSRCRVTFTGPITSPSVVVNIICLIWPSDSRFQKGTESLEISWSRGSNSHIIISSRFQIPSGSYPFILKRWNSKRAFAVPLGISSELELTKK